MCICVVSFPHLHRIAWKNASFCTIFHPKNPLTHTAKVRRCTSKDLFPPNECVCVRACGWAGVSVSVCVYLCTCSYAFHIHRNSLIGKDGRYSQLELIGKVWSTQKKSTKKRFYTANKIIEYQKTPKMKAQNETQTSISPGITEFPQLHIFCSTVVHGMPFTSVSFSHTYIHISKKKTKTQ